MGITHKSSFFDGETAFFLHILKKGDMMKLLNVVNGFIWGVPGLILILSVGILLSVRTGWVQFRFFPAALRQFLSSFRKTEDKGISSYKALCTALAATVGTGNLAGVAGAIALGGPGAVFWMWICALLGMATKFAEAALSVRYRVRASDGIYMGGPMYIVRQGMGRKWQPLAGIYCFFGVVAAFGVGSATQINTVLGGINGVVRSLGGRESDLWNLIIGTSLAILLVLVLLGGAKRIGSAAAFCCFIQQILLGVGVGNFLECSHEVDEFFNAFGGDCIVDACADTANGAVTLQTDHAGCFCFLRKKTGGCHTRKRVTFQAVDVSIFIQQEICARVDVKLQ